MLSYALTSILIGFLATLSMTSFLWLITKLKLCDVHMVRAIGSWLTRDEKNALIPGTIAHFTVGIMISFAYIILFQVLPNPQDIRYIYVIMGGGAGFVHGIVMALFLVILIAEHHPLARFRKAGIKVAVYHFFAHIIYGIIIGTLYTFWLFGQHYG